MKNRFIAKTITEEGIKILVKFGDGDENYIKKENNVYEEVIKFIKTEGFTRTNYRERTKIIEIGNKRTSKIFDTYEEIGDYLTGLFDGMKINELRHFDGEIIDFIRDIEVKINKKVEEKKEKRREKFEKMAEEITPDM